MSQNPWENGTPRNWDVDRWRAILVGKPFDKGPLAEFTISEELLLKITSNPSENFHYHCNRSGNWYYAVRHLTEDADAIPFWRFYTNPGD